MSRSCGRKCIMAFPAFPALFFPLAATGREGHVYMDVTGGYTDRHEDEMKDKGEITMNYMNMTPNMNLACALAEDVGAPELRSPLTSGMRGRMMPRLRRFLARLAR